MPLDEGRSRQPVPFDDVASAYSAGNDLDEHFVRAGLGRRHVFETDIPVVMPDGNLHSMDESVRSFALIF